jgi:hypothetical protein
MENGKFIWLVECPKFPVINVPDFVFIIREEWAIVSLSAILSARRDRK